VAHRSWRIIAAGAAGTAGPDDDVLQREMAMSAYKAARDVDLCLECGAALCSEACRACAGPASSWFICEECGGKGQLLLCPNRASHSLPAPDQRAAEWNYWHGPPARQSSNPFFCKA
jgi:hypothetical protein